MWTMRVLAIVVALLPALAHADPVDDLDAKGEELAKLGNWTLAIDAFKQADAQRPSAKHACLIGLAYTRRELWPQAELFFARCRGRASGADPLPEWLGDAQKQLDEKLTAANTVAVSFAITPGIAAPQISVSSFAPDEKFAPQMIHLAPGAYTIRVTADNYVRQQREIVIEASGPRSATVVFELEPVHPAPSKIPPLLFVTGASLLASAIAVDIWSVGPARDKAAMPLSVATQPELRDAYTVRRNIDVGLYAAGIGALAAAFVLRATVFHRAEVTAALTHDRAFVAITWAR
jgi:hypothetical protein